MKLTVSIEFSEWVLTSTPYTCRNNLIKVLEVFLLSLYGVKKVEIK